MCVRIEQAAEKNTPEAAGVAPEPPPGGNGACAEQGRAWGWKDGPREVAVAGWHRIRTMRRANRARGCGAPAAKLPKAPTIVMLDLAPPPLSSGPRPAPRRVTIRATRPALVDLRFTGDACVIGDGRVAAVCLGDYRIGQLAVTPFDVPSLNSTFWQVRLGQARRNQARRRARN